MAKYDDASAESTRWDLTASHGFVRGGSRDAEDGGGLVDGEGGSVLFVEVAHVRTVRFTTHSTTHTSGPTTPTEEVCVDACRSTAGGGACAATVVARTLDLAQWAGQWVALDVNDQVVRDERTLSGLLAAIDAEGLEGLTACRAPRPDAPIDFGTVFSCDFSGAD